MINEKVTFEGKIVSVQPSRISLGVRPEDIAYELTVLLILSLV